MKKYLSLLTLLIGSCASLPDGVDPSPVCLYDIEGLECQREQVWQMRDGAGFVFESDHTRVWFKEHEDCKRYVNNPDNRPYLKTSDSGYIRWCGSSGRGGSSHADFSNYYIYTDGETDGDFYYRAEFLLSVPNTRSPYPNRKEGFVPMFTSRSALNTFLKAQGMDNKALKDFKKVKIKRMY